MSDTNQKPQQLSSAIYFITSFWAEQEPLKWRLRELSTDLAALGMSFNNGLFKEREFAGLETRKIVLETLSLLLIAKNVGLVSHENYALLDQELSKYLDSIGFPVAIETKNGQPFLSSRFFNGETRELGRAETSASQVLKDKTDEEARQLLPSMSVRQKTADSKGQISDNANRAPQHEEKSLKQFGAVSVKKNSRQSVIIGLLKRKKEIMIKDVSPFISGCSEKTIQRELSAMVAAGILRKMGDKRWSRYSLA